MEHSHPRTLIGLTSDDVIVVRRIAGDGLTQKILIARISYQAKVPPKDFEIKLDGKLVDVDVTFNFEADRGFLNGDFRTRDIVVSEWSHPGVFMNVMNESFNQRQNQL